MIAFKGFTKDLTAVLGRGSFQFEPGMTYTEERSKCASGGFHCAEYPFDCFDYYALNGNRFFMVEAQGSIDEDETGSRIACTELTLLEELTVQKLAYWGMEYMIRHPVREWEKKLTDVCVRKEKAELEWKSGPGAVIIARGRHPAVKGPLGSTLGLLSEEPEEGIFKAARLFVVDGSKWKADAWYTIDDNGMIVEAGNETKKNNGFGSRTAGA